MYSKVVVPLDGSKLAEVALPHVEEIAQGCNIPQILLVSVTEPLRATLPSDGPISVEATQFGTIVYPEDLWRKSEIERRLGKMGKTALNYLVKIAKQFDKKGLKTGISVLIGKPAEEIIRFAEEQGADLIVIASRGKSGFSRWDMGNVAEKVIRGAKVPVVVVKPEPGFKETKPRRRGVPG
jgi:nucleotide-binding universal stress UspA family protein